VAVAEDEFLLDLRLHRRDVYGRHRGALDGLGQASLSSGKQTLGFEGADQKFLNLPLLEVWELLPCLRLEVTGALC